MANYENMHSSEVQRLAKQGNKDALFEMVWRIDELQPAEYRNGPVERFVWHDYWFEKAADAGHIVAKARYARSLVDRIKNAEDRQKAIRYYQSLVDDFDAGKLSGDDREWGEVAKLWLGVMLCEGYHTQRDAIKGAKLIKEADALTNGFEGFGFKVMETLGGVFGQGCAQSGGDPSIDDLKQAIKYQEIAINRFNAEKDDPNNRGYLDFAKNYLEILKKRKESKEEIKKITGKESTYYSEFAKWQEDMMKISSDAQDWLDAKKTAMKRLRERLAREGW